MNKEQFMTTLGHHLQALSQAERQDILSDIEEHFSVGLAKGETEEYITASLGSPEKIAEEILVNSNVDNIPKSSPPRNDTRTLFLGILLIIFNFIIVLGPFVGLIGVIFSFWVTGFVFIIAPLLTL